MIVDNIILLILCVLLIYTVVYPLINFCINEYKKNKEWKNKLDLAFKEIENNGNFDILHEIIDDLNRMGHEAGRHIDSKICYRCNRDLPLYKFKRTESKYILEKMPNAKGRCFACEECVSKLK